MRATWLPLGRSRRSSATLGVPSRSPRGWPTSPSLLTTVTTDWLAALTAWTAVYACSLFCASRRAIFSLAGCFFFSPYNALTLSQGKRAHKRSILRSMIKNLGCLLSAPGSTLYTIDYESLYNNATPVVYQILLSVVKVPTTIDCLRLLRIPISERLAAQKYVCTRHQEVYTKSGLFYSAIMYSV